MRSGGAAALPIFTLFIFQREAAWRMFVCCDWRRRLWLKKSARVFHVEEPVMRDLVPSIAFVIVLSLRIRNGGLSNYPTRVPKGGRASYTTSWNRYRSDDGQRKPLAEKGATGV